MIHITIRLPQSLYDAMRNEARRRGESFGAYLRFIAQKDMENGMRVDAAVARVIQELITNGDLSGGNGAFHLPSRATNTQGGSTDE